jgi:hypothetical protein
MSNKKIDISKEGFENLLNQVLINANEERNLALDRYRAQDEQIETLEDFMAIGKDSVAYLKLASERTNLLVNVADKFKDIVHSTGESAGEVSSKGGISDDLRKQIEATVEAKNKKDEDDQLTEGLDTE